MLWAFACVFWSCNPLSSLSHHTYLIVQHISVCCSRISQFVVAECTGNYGYLSFTFCFWRQCFVLSVNVLPAVKLDQSKHKHSRQLVSLDSVPEGNMEQSEIKPHDVSEWYSWMWDNHCRIHHPKNKASEHHSNSSCSFHTPDTFGPSHIFHKALFIFRCIRKNKQTQNYTNYIFTISEENVNGAWQN